MPQAPGVAGQGGPGGVRARGAQGVAVVLLGVTICRPGDRRNELQELRCEHGTVRAAVQLAERPGVAAARFGPGIVAWLHAGVAGSWTM